MFKAASQIEYNNAVIVKTEADIRACEDELQRLKEITADKGIEGLGVKKIGWMSFRNDYAIKERANWLMDKMGASVDKLNVLERSNEDMVRILSSGHK